MISTIDKRQRERDASFQLWDRISRFASKGGITLLDQSLFAGTNFVVNILIARWLSPTEYGAFATAYAVFLLLASFHTAILTEPMMVFGAGKYNQHFERYLNILVTSGHWIVAGAISLVLGIAASIFWTLSFTNLASAFTGLAVASPFILLWWTVRQSFYIGFRQHWALIGSLLNVIYLIIILSVLLHFSIVSQGWLFTAMGMAGLSASLTLLLIRSLSRPDDGTELNLHTIAMDHWNYGSWNVLATGVYWASGHILMLFVPLVLGLSSTAVIAAVVNLFRPLHLFMQSISLLVLPAFSRQIQRESFTLSLRRQVVGLVAVSSCLAFLYGMVLTAFSDTLLHLIYQGKYDGYQGIVLLFALSYTASSAVQIFTMVLKAFQDTRSLLTVWSTSALIMTLLSIPMMVAFGLAGGIITLAFSYIAAAKSGWNKIKTVEVT
jgi:O-antigen/teichoic acid export membrane protein